MALRGDLDCLPAGALQLANDARKISRRPPKIVMGYHHARGRKSAPQLIRCHFPSRFDFDVAPPATGAHRLRQDFNLGFSAASKSPASLPASAGCDQYGAGPLAAQPAQEGSPFLGVAKIVEAQFQRPGRSEAQTRLRPHFARCSSGDHPADAIFPKRTFQATLHQDLKLKASTMVTSL